MRSISRAARRRDAELAALRIPSAAEGSRLLLMENGVDRLLHHDDYRRQFRPLLAAEVGAAPHRAVQEA
eukprot:7414891-Pyramimonas_sp.AAC.1